MRNRNGWKLVTGAALLATLLYALLAVPGLLTDGASTVPAHRLEALR